MIAGEKEPPERNEKMPERKEAKPGKCKFDLVVDIQKKMAQGKNGGYVQWAKKYNVKQFAESILFYSSMIFTIRKRWMHWWTGVLQNTMN